MPTPLENRPSTMPNASRRIWGQVCCVCACVRACVSVCVCVCECV